MIGQIKKVLNKYSCFTFLHSGKECMISPIFHEQKTSVLASSDNKIGHAKAPLEKNFTQGAY